MISDWLSQNVDLIDRDRPVLDVASGRGRHALWLAAAGYHVVAVDRDESALAALAHEASSRALVVVTRVVDLEAASVDLGDASYGAVVVFNYLHRPLVPALVRALDRGGVLIYETFTNGQAQRGHPRNPLFLLDEGELQRIIAPLEIVREREGEFDGKLISSIAARKP